MALNPWDGVLKVGDRVLVVPELLDDFSIRTGHVQAMCLGSQNGICQPGRKDLWWKDCPRSPSPTTLTLGPEDTGEGGLTSAHSTWCVLFLFLWEAPVCRL